MKLLLHQMDAQRAGVVVHFLLLELEAFEEIHEFDFNSDGELTVSLSTRRHKRIEFKRKLTEVLANPQDLSEESKVTRNARLKLIAIICAYEPANVVA